MRLEDFAGIATGDDIYVLGSGATLTHIDPGFFDNKTVIATNRVAERMGLYERGVQVYTHTHYHHEDALPLADKYRGYLFFAPEGDQGFAGQPTTRHEQIIYYPHTPTVYDFNPWRQAPPAGGLLVGSTSLHGSMHLAAHMGAANIILAGADCGLLDGEANQTGYRSGNLYEADEQWRLEWLSRWEQHLRLVKAWLQEQYPVRISSLLPFLNPNLEGHNWTPAPIP